MGHASEANLVKVEQELQEMFAEGERLLQAYKLLRDLVVFTDKRLIIVDKQGMTAKKKSYLSIPYKQIAMYSCETKGRFDMDAEIKIWHRGSSQPVSLEMGKNKFVMEINRTLSNHVLE
jgi:hypothetical protein